MSDAKKEGLGIFVNRKAGATDVGGNAQGPKNVTKRWKIVAAAVAVFSIVAASMFRDPPSGPPTGPKKAESMIDVTPKNAEQANWQTRSQMDISALKDSVMKLSEENKGLAQKLAEKSAAPSKNQLPPGIVPPPAPPGTTNLDSLGSAPVPPPAPPAPPIPPASMRNAPPAPSLPNSSAPGAPMQYAPGSNSAGEALQFKPEALKTSKNAKDGDAVKAKVSYAKNAYSGMLLPGAFAPIALLNGLDAGTATASQSNPQPVLMNVVDQATLPGAAKYRIKSCFVLASAYGDLSAERVYFRLSQLSCVDKASRLVMSSPVKGYVVDSDGKLGMRGVVNDRQGAKLGKALLAGFAQGLGSALGSAQSSVTSSALGSVSSITGGAALKQSGLTGASTAASQLASFYLKEAQNIFPVITIDNGRTGSMVFTEGVALQWGQGDVQYSKEVTPE